MMKLNLITLAVLPIIFVIATPIDSETKAIEAVNIPAPAPKPKEFFGNIGKMFSNFGKKKVKDAANENKTASDDGGLDGIFGEVKKTIDGAAGEIKKTGDVVTNVQSRISKMFSGGTDSFKKGFQGLNKKKGSTNDAAAANLKKEESPDGLEEIGSMVGGIVDIVKGKKNSNAPNKESNDGIGSMVSNILHVVMPESKDNLTLQDLGVPQK